MKVNELFESLQGESSLSGLPFFFIRLAGCNLRCRYCDTTYAYEEGREMGIDELCLAAVRSGRKRVLVTGGEPLLQPETPRLLQALLDRDLTVLLETNGSIDLRLVPRPVIRVMDIKTPDSGESQRTVWRNIELLATHDQVKFVVCSLEDCRWAEDIIRRFDLTRRCSVLISPGDGTISADRVAEWLLGTNLDLRLQVQLHKVIWGKDRRGV